MYFGIFSFWCFCWLIGLLYEFVDYWRIFVSFEGLYFEIKIMMNCECLGVFVELFVDYYDVVIGWKCLLVLVIVDIWKWNYLELVGLLLGNCWIRGVVNFLLWLFLFWVFWYVIFVFKLGIVCEVRGWGWILWKGRFLREK